MMHQVTLVFVLPRTQNFPSPHVDYDYSGVNKFDDWVKENSIDICYSGNSWVNGTLTKHISCAKAEDAALIKLVWG